MICVKLTCSCIIALLHRWQILRWSEHVVVVFSAVFPNFSQHKMQRHPSATVTAAQHISGASLNFPRSSSTSAKLFTAMSVRRCSGPSRRSRASRSRRRSGSASAKAPRASSTSASLSRGAPREPKSSPRLRGERALFWLFVVSWHISGSKSLVGKQNSVFQIVLISLEQLLQAILFDAVWCCLMLVVNTVAIYSFHFAALRHFWMQISGDKTIQSWLNNTCLLPSGNLT